MFGKYKGQVLSGLKYGFHVIFRPFDGFYDLKHEKRGNPVSATIILIVMVLTWLLNQQYSGYFFSSYDPSTYKVFIQMCTVLIACFRWGCANWCLTTLMDGEGSMKDVYIATAYSLVPVILIMLPLTLISNVMCQDESAYYNFFMILAFAWLGFLIFISTMTTHQYTVWKTVVTCVLTIMGMLLIIFICLLFFSVIQKVLFFIQNSYNELSFRIY